MMRRSFWTAAATMAGAATIGLAGIAYGHAGHDETDYGKPGDPSKPARIIQIVMREADGKMLFQPDRLTVRKGEQVRFLLRNNGVLEHEFVVGTVEDNLRHMKEMAKHPDMVHDDPNARRLKSKAMSEIVWQFTKVGTFDFSCLIPGHREAGMFGTIIVE